MAIAPTSDQFLTGGLQDTNARAGLQKFVPEIWGAAVQDYMEKNLVYGNLATDLSGMVAGGGDLIHLPQHDELTANDLYSSANSAALQTDTGSVADGIVFNDTGTAGSEYQLIVNKSHYAAFSISDLVKAQSSYELMSIYTQKMGYALAKKIDAEISKKIFTSLTYNDGANGDANGSLVGNLIDITGAGSYNIDKAGIANVIQAVHSNDSNLDDWTMVLHPKTYASLFKLDDFARYDVIGSAMDAPRVSGYVGKLAGVDVVVSNNFVYVTSGESAYTVAGATPVFNSTDITTEADHLAGYMIHKDAINIAWAANMKSRVQSEYDLTSLSNRFVADTVYGVTLVGNAGTNKRLFACMDA